MKNLPFVTFYCLFLFLTINSFGQYHYHGKYENLEITSDFFGYWTYHYDHGSHGGGFELYRQDGWNNQELIKEGVTEFGGTYVRKPFFLNDSVGFIAQEHQASVQVLITANYGNEWGNYGGGSGMNFSMYFLDAITGYISHYPESNPVFIHGMGNGSSWQSSDYTIKHGTSLLYFINESTGFLNVVDTLNNYCLLKTDDFGETWNVNYSDSTIFANDIRFVNNVIGIFVADHGVIMKTLDAGDNWDQIINPVTVNLNCIRYYNETEAIIAGDSGVILQSYDGGDTWTKEENNLETNLNILTITESRLFIQDEEWNLYSDKEVGMDNYSDISHFNIYPNPVIDVLSILGLNEKNNKISIFGTCGELIQQSFNHHQLDVSFLKPGIYFLKIEFSDDDPIIKKFIKT